ncbi:hypothetical protein ACIRD6_04990 [Streptomyces sp. NPDC102473]
MLDACVVGRETPAYAAAPAFNADGGVTREIIAARFGLPDPS